MVRGHGVLGGNVCGAEISECLERCEIAVLLARKQYPAEASSQRLCAVSTAPVMRARSVCILLVRVCTSGGKVALNQILRSHRYVRGSLAGKSFILSVSRIPNYLTRW